MADNGKRSYKLIFHTVKKTAAANSIIEIAIRIFDGEKVIEDFETLVNPGQVIPKYIQAFTGITNEMVEDAPRFEEIAEKVFTCLQGNIFVAHAVNFDYSFIKSHLEFYGYSFNAKKLCTVRLSRQIFPGLPSYSLGNLCMRHCCLHLLFSSVSSIRLWCSIAAKRQIT